MSYLTQSFDELQTQVIAALQTETGLTFHPLTETITEFYSRCLGQSTAWLTKSYGQLLAELNVAMGGSSISHLRYSYARLLDTLDATLDAGSVVGLTSGILVANRTQIATTTANITAPFTCRRSHWSHSAGAITNIQCFESNRYISTTSATAGGGNNTRKKYLEYPADVFHQVKWSGATTVALSSSTRVKSDVVISSVTGLPLVIPANTKFWERTVVTVGSSTTPVFQMPANHTTLGLDDGTSASDLGNSGTIAANAGTNTFGSQAFIGDVAANSARAFVLVGDSLCYGTGDITSVGVMGGSGWMARMLDNLGIPYMKWAFPAQEATEAAALISSINADLAQIGFTDFACQYGLNDLRLGRTKAQIEADFQTIYGMSNLSGKTLWQSTMSPRSDSTDSWATTENQTPKTDGTMTSLNALNADIRNGLPGITPSCIEAADAFMSARDSGIHKAPPAGTLDGTHPDSTRTALIAGLVSV